MKRQPDPVIVRQVAIIVALLLVNAFLEFRYKSESQAMEDTESDIYWDEPFVYTAEEEHRSEQNDEQRPLELQQAGTILQLVDDLFMQPLVRKVALPPTKFRPIAPIRLRMPNDESIIVDSFMSSLPQFPGGHDALQRYVQDHFFYTHSMYEHGRDMMVVMSFVVKKNGELTDIQVVKSSVRGVGLEEKATELFLGMPRWVPGNNGDLPLNVHVQLPLSIQIY